MAKQKNAKNLTKQFVGKPLPQVDAVSTDATAVKPKVRQRKQIGNYKQIDSSKADFIKDYGLPIAGGILGGPLGAVYGGLASAILPPNIKQLGSKLLGDARMSDSSISDEQKVMLWDVIQAAKKRTGTPDGGTEYSDYGTLGLGSSEQYNEWFNRGNIGLVEGAYNSFTNPGFQLGSTVGRGNYFTDPENPDKIYYTDVYDWNPGEKYFSGNKIYQKVRNTLRAGEDQNLNAQKNDNYRMNFTFDAKEIEKLRNKKNGGWLDKYNDGGPVQENYNDYSVSASEGFQGDGYSNVGRNYSPAWGGQFQEGGKVKPIIVNDKNDPRLKAYKDSLDVRTRSNQTFKPGSKTRPLTKKEQEFWKDEKTGLAPNLVERIGPGQDYFGHFKKPTQPIIYQKPQPKPTSQEIIDWIEGNTRDENSPTRLGTSEDEKQYAMGGEMPTDKKSQKFYNTLKDYYTSPDRTLVEKAKYAAFNQLNEKHGYAPVKIADRTITGKRSMINPFTGRLNLVVPEDPEIGEIESVPQKLMDAYMHEYGHYQQYNQNPEESKLKKSGRFLGHMFTDFGNMFKNTKGFNFTEGYQKNYETPGTIEHEAHRVIQPKLEEELLNLGRQNFRNRYNMAMGGSLPGATGHFYARYSSGGSAPGDADYNAPRNINPAPSKGPYGKKTVASAQNGTEMRYYQEGLDFKPKTISKNGSELKKLDQLTNFTNYNPTKPSGWLEKYQ